MAYSTKRQSRSRLTFSPVEWELLASAVEDVYGLWEALATVRSAPLNIPEREVLAVARETLTSLLERGLIYICWFRHERNQEERVSTDEATKLLADPSRWEPPAWNDRYVAFAATPQGTRAWERAPVPSRNPVH